MGNLCQCFQSRDSVSASESPRPSVEDLCPQPAMDFCVERLALGEWVHIFPEGRVNVDKENIR